MKTLASVLALVVVVLIAALFLQQRQTTELQTRLSGYANDQETTRKELRRLNDRIAELQQSAAAAASKPAESSASAKASAEQPPAEPVPTPGVTVAAPVGWWKNGRNPEKYVVGVDSNETWGGMPSAYVQSVGDATGGFGGMMQTVAAENFVGKRVRLSAWVKTRDANDGGGHLWLRIDGQERGQMLGFDNMDNRPVKGNSDWQEASVVLDVPAGSAALAYGFFVSGKGKMWVSGQTMQEVGPEVPTTNMLKARTAAMPKSPTNLGFDPKMPK